MSIETLWATYDFMKYLNSKLSSVRFLYFIMKKTFYFEQQNVGLINANYLLSIHHSQSWKLFQSNGMFYLSATHIRARRASLKYILNLHEMEKLSLNAMQKTGLLISEYETEVQILLSQTRSQEKVFGPISER